MQPRAKGPSLAYRVETVLLDGDDRIETARLTEYGSSSATDAQLLSKRDDEEVPARTEAEEFLRAILGDGPVPAKRIKQEAEDAGVAWRTVERAKTKLGVRSEKAEGTSRGSWVWVLPEGGGLPEDVAVFQSQSEDRHISERGGLPGGGGGVVEGRQDRHTERDGGLPGGGGGMTADGFVAVTAEDEAEIERVRSKCSKWGAET